MPEAPEALINERFLRKLFLGKKITKIVSNTKSYVKLPKIEKVVDTGSHGKIFWLKTRSMYIHIHLGISGWFVTEKPKIFKYVLESNGTKAYLEDRRRFSKIIITNNDKHTSLIKKLGINIMSNSFTFDKFVDAIKSRDKMISALLLDQSVFAGVGNYIRNEALYRARISPTRSTSKLDIKMLKNLYNAIRYIAFSVAREWFISYKIKYPMSKIEPEKVTNNYLFQVYGRDKDRYGNKVTIETIAGRDTYYVKKLQK